MKVYVLMLWLGYTVPAGVDGIGGGAALTSQKHVFWSEKSCLKAAGLQIGAWEKAGFKRYSAVCMEDVGPSTEEPKLGLKGQ